MHKKVKFLGKLARLIAVESKLAGGDINSASLRTAMKKAKKENMPSDNIDRAVKKTALVVKVHKWILFYMKHMAQEDVLW